MELISKESPWLPNWQCKFGEVGKSIGGKGKSKKITLETVSIIQGRDDSGLNGGSIGG